MRSKIGSTQLHIGAAFLYDTPDGFAFITPGYKDPNGSPGHTFHRLVATVQPAGDGFEFDGPEWSGTVEAYEPSASQLEKIGFGLEWFESLGLDLKNERRHLKKHLRHELRGTAR